jgi:multiple sugar transport system permease protein
MTSLKRSRDNKQYSYDWPWVILLLGPGLFLLCLLILIPVIGTIITSMNRDITFMDSKWVGLSNYTGLFKDTAFRQSMRFTISFIAVSVPLELFFGLGLALLMNYKSSFRGIIRSLVLIPWAIPAVISGRIWELIYNVNYGLANYIIEQFGFEKVNWLGTSLGAFWAIIIADLWKTIPFVAIILLAGLASIPETLYQQAQIDGASFLRRFYSITLPLLRPVIVVALLFRTIDALRIFDLVFILTSGGPGGSTTSLSQLGFKYFVGGDFGYGSTLSVIIFLCALALSLLVIKFGKFSQEAI